MAKIKQIWEVIMLIVIVASIIIPGALDFWLPCGAVDIGCGW